MVIVYLLLQMTDIKCTSVHSHPASQDYTEACKVRQSLKDMAQQTRDDPARLLAQTTSRLPVETRLEVGKSESVRRTLRRQRRAALPEEPKCTGDFILDEPWTTTGGSDPQEFLVHDSGKESPDRVLVFASPRGLETLAQATDWFVDGTFSVCPRIFKQLYVIRTLVEGIPVTCAYGLLPGKKRMHYEEFFQAVLNACEKNDCTADPENVHLDFETSSHQAIHNVLGSIVGIKGCFYHLTQGTWRKIQVFGLSTLYKENTAVKQFCGMIDGLAYLPEEDVIEGI